MNVVAFGGNYKIYGDGLDVYQKIPAGYYGVSFNPQEGFSLHKRSDIVPAEQKVYGSHLRKVDKVLSTHKRLGRNMGIILSGVKGSGKSLFAQILASKFVSEGGAVIVVDTNIHGIAGFLMSIRQDVLVLFDEFEKVFIQNRGEQDALLPLFDGLDCGNKLFVITCNGSSDGISEYMLNRTGRFHYHFEFSTPCSDDIRQYMNDKLDDCDDETIEKIVSFACEESITFDCLRAIAFDMNLGYSLEETIEDLNISFNTIGNRYIVRVTMEDGMVLMERGDRYSSLSDGVNGVKRIDAHDDKEERYVIVKFPSEKLKYNSRINTLELDVKDISEIGYYFDDDEVSSEEQEYIRSLRITSVTFERVVEQNTKYGKALRRKGMF